MANEGTIKISFSLKKGDIDESWDLGTLQFDVAGTRYLKNVQTVGTSEEALVLGDCGVGGYIVYRNLDKTNYIELREGTGVADSVRILAGDIGAFRIPPTATAPFVIADTAACRLEYFLVEL